ncbi:MAG: UDP-N-acetylmuramoyl-L-alanine--D-glutamate ligase [Deltaproteobacteria bacterium]|nr:UDP-N-acetylmuramoyl-L-alanine--D-glutamate ligase [Deltaproteobacteria bacterium]
MLDVRGKRVLVVGLARSGIAAAHLAEKLGARVTATDMRRDVAIEGYAGALVLGENPARLADDADLVIVSPGVPITNAILARARALGRPVWSEVEFAWRHLATRTIAITGTAGKSTTVALVGQMLAASGIRAFVGGNIGTPLSSATGSFDWLVVEVSSFQLETVDAFRPDIAAILNISENHLDRHADMDEYVAAKARIFARQGVGDVVILNEADARLAAMEPPVGVSRKRFRGPGDEVFGCAGNRFDATKRKIPGAHNLFNIAMATELALLAGAQPSAVQQTIDSFPGLAHRLELVREWRGVRFYNDSKATTVDAVVRSLASFSTPIVWIAGGRDKGGDWSRVGAHVTKHPLRTALFIGEAAPLIARSVVGELCGDLKNAVSRALNIAKPGDVVLLSPGCASYDQFVDFEDRGNQFRHHVEELRS